MKKTIVVFIIFFLAGVLLAEGSVQGMLICIHESAHHKKGTFHFHPGDLFKNGHHPCRLSLSETCDAHRETTCRHIPVRVYSLDNPPLLCSDTKFFKTVLTCTFEYQPQTAVSMSFANGSTYPPLPSRAAAFRETTVLII